MNPTHHAGPIALDRVLADVLQGSRLGVLLLTPQAMLCWTNLAGARLLGSTVEALQGKPLRGLFSADAAQQPMLDRLEACIAGRGAAPAAAELKLCDGRRWLRVELQALSPEVLAAQGLGAAVALSDVTEQRRWREEAGRVNDITEREQHARALLDKDEAERASRAKSDFLSRVSHELRTPLNAVLGFSQLLQQRAAELPPWTAEPLRLIQRAGDHLVTLLDDLLDLGSSDSGGPRLMLQRVSLDAVVTEAMRLVSPQALAAGVTLRRWAPSQAWAHADPLRLRQVLLILLSNGIKYNRRDGEVRLLLLREAAGVVLRVIDTGPGLSAAQRQQLFQPFNRLGAEGRGEPGSGLGLALARQLTEAMGGRLELAAEVMDGGTELRLVLQPAEPAASPAAPSAALPGPAAPPSAQAPACHVLYIEDHPVNAMLVREALAMQQPIHRLRLADSGEQGLAMVAEERPDVVLLDLHLPGADGYAVLARLRSDPATARLPCIAVSADAMPEEVARARAAGFDDYWTKPLAMQGLAERIAARVAACQPAAAGEAADEGRDEAGIEVRD